MFEEFACYWLSILIVTSTFQYKLAAFIEMALCELIWRAIRGQSWVIIKCCIPGFLKVLIFLFQSIPEMKKNFKYT